MSKEVINLRKGLQGKHTDLFSSQLCICSFIHIRFGRRTWFQRGCSQTDIRPVISLRHSGHTKLQRRRRAGRQVGRDCSRWTGQCVYWGNYMYEHWARNVLLLYQAECFQMFLSGLVDSSLLCKKRSSQSSKVWSDLFNLLLTSNKQSKSQRLAIYWNERRGNAANPEN